MINSAHFHNFSLGKRQIIGGNIEDIRAKVTIKAQYHDFNYQWTFGVTK